MLPRTVRGISIEDPVIVREAVPQANPPRVILSELRVEDLIELPVELRQQVSAQLDTRSRRARPRLAVVTHDAPARRVVHTHMRHVRDRGIGGLVLLGRAALLEGFI